MKGRKPIPTKLKVLMGNPGKRKSDIERDEPGLEPCIPEMPGTLAPYPLAVSEWDREVKILFAMGLMTPAEVGVLAQRCYLAQLIYDESEALREAENKNYKQITGMIREYRALGSLLGLDPSSRVKLAVTPAKKEKSKFDGLIGVKK